MLAENSVKSGRKSFVELLINPLEEQEQEQGAVDIVEGMMKVSGLRRGGSAIMLFVADDNSTLSMETILLPHFSLSGTWHSQDSEIGCSIWSTCSILHYS